jgi:predicted lipoprotein with Yx(FWY)xxD motif
MALAALGTACGGTTIAASPTTTPPTNPSGTAPDVAVATTSLGNIRVNPHGLTLYVSQADTKTASACGGGHTTAWPPLHADAQPTLGPGLHGSAVENITRSDGNSQVTYGAHPLYLYFGDSKRGETTGQGVNAFGANWYVISPVGKEITTTSSASISGNGY